MEERIDVTAMTQRIGDIKDSLGCGVSLGVLYPGVGGRTS